MFEILVLNIFINEKFWLKRGFEITMEVMIDIENDYIMKLQLK